MGEARIEKFSPSTVNALQTCGLAVFLQRSRSTGRGRMPSNPVARLGTAAHRVLAWIADNAPEVATAEDLDRQILQRWQHEAAIEGAEAMSFAVEAANGPIEHWPMFARIQEGVIVDGAELARELSALPPERRRAEWWIEADGADIRGSIDLVIVGDNNQATVVDHKAGAVSEASVAPGGSYATQVLLYAALVKEAGLTPASAEVRPLSGARRQVPVSDELIAEALSVARKEVERYNVSVAAGEPVRVARPSEASCQWCEFLLDCPAIWSDQAPGLGAIRNVEGTVTRLERSPAGALALQLVLHDETVVTVSGLSDTNVVGPVPTVGEAVRIVGLRESGPRRLRAGRGRTAMSALVAIEHVVAY